MVAYVIMPNHLHVILHFHCDNFDLNKIIANGKRFLAYEIVNRLEAEENATILNRLKSLVTERERKKDNFIKYLKTLLTPKLFSPIHFYCRKLITSIIIRLLVNGCWQKILWRMNTAVPRFMKYNWYSILNLCTIWIYSFH